MNTKENLKPDSRLLLAASFVRHGSNIADIGTDHAYIPIYLLKNKLCSFAIASDINKGPLERAKNNASLHNINENIEFYLTNGLDNLPLMQKNITDIIICGMGGELIASIINACDYVKSSSINLILQPMSSISELRLYLDLNGFWVKDEGICKSGGKLYQCMLASYDGVIRQSTQAELALGKININKNEELLSNLLFQTYAREMHKLLGKKSGSLNTESEEMFLNELANIAKEKRITI